jgi:PIN domain nuclease of toxin-antitoxin system
MRVLLDTHAFLWFILDDPQLSPTAKLHHKDPFDRMIIAQAMVEGVPVVSADAAFDSYPVTRLW